MLVKVAQNVTTRAEKHQRTLEELRKSDADALISSTLRSKALAEIEKKKSMVMGNKKDLSICQSLFDLRIIHAAGVIKTICSGQSSYSSYEEFHPYFIKDMMKNGISESLAEKIYEKLADLSK